MGTSTRNTKEALKTENRSTKLPRNPRLRLRSRKKKYFLKIPAPMIMATQGTIVNTGKQLKCTRTDEWTQRWGYICTMQ